ncbi:MAG: hypothetical protein ABI175_02235 [Polyangiales bacterium]
MSDDGPSLSPEEFARRVERALREEDEIASIRALIVWFRRRYPTAKERLAYVRKKHAEWTRRPSFES